MASSIAYTVFMGSWPDVAIVGGGAIGLACAWRLAQSGADVVVFESGEIGGEASFAAGGMLAPGPESAIHQFGGTRAMRDAMFELCVQSRDLYPAFAAELLEQTGVDVELCQIGSPTCDWRQPGILLVPDEEIGDSNSVLYNGREAFWFERDGQVEPRLLTRALRLACEQAGVEIHQNTPVQRIEIKDARAVAVVTGDARYSTENIVLCAGAWSGQFGLPDAATPPVRPVAGQMLQLCGGQTLKHIIYGAHCYLIPRRDGRLLVGATIEEIGFEKRVTPENTAQLLGTARELAPIVNEMPLETSWSGLRPVSPDGLPILGGGPIENLIYATGHGRNGILLAPRTAELVVGALLRDEEAPAEFGLARFVETPTCRV